jgi:hypothetical protein
LQSADWISKVWQHHPEHHDVEGPNLRREVVDVTVVDLSLRSQCAMGILVCVLDAVDVPLEVPHKLLRIEVRVGKEHAIPVRAVTEIE